MMPYSLNPKPFILETEVYATDREYTPVTSKAPSGEAEPAAKDIGEVFKQRKPNGGYVAGYADARADALYELGLALRDIKEGDDAIQRLDQLQADIRSKSLPQER